MVRQQGRAGRMEMRRRNVREDYSNPRNRDRCMNALNEEGDYGLDDVVEGLFVPSFSRMVASNRSRL